MSGWKRRTTYQDAEPVPINCVGELVDDTLYTSPRPASLESRAVSRLEMLLGRPFDLGEEGPGGWVILSEPELQLGEDALVAELAGWRRERMPELPHTEAFTLAPDWVCEVLSPATAALDREKKMQAYARAGVSHLWLVDPHQQSLEAYRLEDQQWTPQGQWSGGGTVHAEPFAALPLKLAPLWER
jgi:Uma2 family endonuclease